MKRVYLPCLMLATSFVLQAQLNHPSISFAASLSEIKIPITIPAPVTIPVTRKAEVQPAAFYLGESYSGNWQSHYPNGNRCDSGQLRDNMPDGLWRSWYPNGQLRMEIHCSSRRLLTAKDEMQRIYKPGYSPNPHQKNMKQLVSNSPYPYDKLLYRQLYIAIHPAELESDLQEVQVNVKNGGKVNSFVTNTPPFTECLVHGLYRTWFPDGTLKDSGSCDNGIREGVWEEWDTEGTVRAVGFYKNGLRWKDWRYYNKEGKLLYINWYNRMEEITETVVLK